MNQRVLVIIIVALGVFALGLFGGAAVSQMGERNNGITASPVATSTNPPTATPPVEMSILPDQASQIALEAVPGATLAQPPILVRFQDVLAYEVRLDRGSIWINAQNGQILYNGTNPNATSSEGLQITPEQAVAIATDYVGGGSVVEVDLEHEDDPRGAAYEILFTNGSKVYVDAATGEVVYARLHNGNAPARPERRGLP